MRAAASAQGASHHVRRVRGALRAELGGGETSLALHFLTIESAPVFAQKPARYAILKGYMCQFPEVSDNLKIAQPILEGGTFAKAGSSSSFGQVRPLIYL